MDQPTMKGKKEKVIISAPWTVFHTEHNINYNEKIKRYDEENLHYYLENTGKI